MRGVDAAVTLSNERKLDNLIRPGEARWHILQRSREAERAIFHRFGHEAAHLYQLIHGRRAIVEADNEGTHLCRADECAEVDADALSLKTAEIFAKRAPVNVDVISLVILTLFRNQAFVDGRN